MGRVITHNRATSLPMSDDVIAQVHRIARRQKADPRLIFLDQHQLEDNYDASDRSSNASYDDYSYQSDGSDNDEESINEYASVHDGDDDDNNDDPNDDDDNNDDDPNDAAEFNNVTHIAGVNNEKWKC